MKKVLVVSTILLFVSCKSKTDWREKYREEKAKNSVSNTKSASKSSTAIHSLEDIASYMDVSVKTLKNKDLYHMILDWYGTPYSFGKQSKSGIDCSGFTQLVYREIYNKELPRRSKDMADLIKRKYTKDLNEGDLVFFSFGGSEINHVGIYLHNNKFVHASTSKGIIISDLTDPWYGNYLVKCGPLQ